MANFNINDLTKLAGSLSPWIAVGEAGFSIVMKVIEAIKERQAREGRVLTQAELHQVAVDCRADFLTLPRPK